MKPLILEYAEIPRVQDLDHSLVEYSEKMNLSVLKGTDFPAIVASTLNTETFTKSEFEASDSDKDRQLKLLNQLDTMTYTLNSQEPSDSEGNIKSFSGLLDTQLVTESKETTDKDK